MLQGRQNWVNLFVIIAVNKAIITTFAPCEIQFGFHNF